VAVSRVSPKRLTQVQANCLASDAVGDSVYVTAPDVGGLIQVTKADPSTSAKMPAIGVIQTKLSSTLCIVKLFGELSGVYTGFTAGDVLYVGAAGTPSHTPGAISQVLGVALSDDIVFISPEYSSSLDADRDSLIFGAGFIFSSVRTRYLFSGYSDSPAELTPVQTASPRTGVVTSIQIYQNIVGSTVNPITYRVRIGNVPSLLNAVVASNATYGATFGAAEPVTLGQPVDVEVTKASPIGAPPANIVVIVEVI